MKLEIVHDRDGTVGIDFIDLLFAVTVAVGFTEITSQPWFRNVSLLEMSTYLRQPIGAFLGLEVLTLSWFGYHASVREPERQIETKRGTISTGVDVLLLVLYWLLIVRFDDVEVQVITLTLIFLFYVLWDQVGAWDTRDRDEGRRERRGVSMFWFLALVGLSAAFFALDGSSSHNIQLATLSCGILVGFLYRLHKRFRRPRHILRLLGTTRMAV